VVCATFLEINGREVVAPQADVVTAMLGVASGEWPEAKFTSWLATNSGR